MAAERVRISCIRKTERLTAYERISHVGGENYDGTRWLLSLPNAIAGIKLGKWVFYIERPGAAPIDVVIIRSADGHEYLKTTADREVPNNLLSLQLCPAV